MLNEKPNAKLSINFDGEIARKRRFTLDGDDALELHLERTCARIVSGIRGLVPRHKLEAVMLGGGYGRGEGGVLRDVRGDRPYNDLECYVVLKGNRHVNELRFKRSLDVFGEILTHHADAEVEFRITSRAELMSLPVTMFSYDLAAGHRLLWGHESGDLIAGWDFHRHPECIPQEEATRLLMNRASGLLFARNQLERRPLTPSAADFVRRNVAKAQLACGDALLAAFGRYHWSCTERHRRLQELSQGRNSAWIDALLRHHGVGVRFKLNPNSGAVSRESLAESLGEVTKLTLKCWLWLEARRLGRPFANARDYVDDLRDKCPHSNPLSNILLNFRADGFRLRLKPSPWRHPRQRIFRALVLLLWVPGAIDDPFLKERIGIELNAPVNVQSDWSSAFRRLWIRVR
ncbi:MAG: hypothetical protein WAK51_17545 [Opitutaceae bacterium]|jgi:hypothetical protein